MREELLKGLTEEQIAKLNDCNSAEEILALAKEEGVTLSDEQLEAVSGGGCGGRELKCPKCKSKNLKKIGVAGNKHYNEYECNDCGHIYKDHY